MQIDLLKVLGKVSQAHNIHLLTISPPFEGLEDFDCGLRRTLYPGFDFARFGELIREKVPDNVLILTKDFTGCRYALFRLPDEPDGVHLFGPWRPGEVSRETRRRLEAEFDERSQIVILEYYSNVRCIEERMALSWLAALLSAAHPDGAFSVKHEPNFLPLSPAPKREQIRRWVAQDELSASIAEERNRMEDAVVHAVTQADLDGAINALRQMHRYPIYEWTDDPLRNAKLQLLKGNARLSKAIRFGAVHPLYSERLFDRYVTKIEGIRSLQEARELALEMLRDYCECVNQHALKEFSPLVQRVINHVNLNLDAPLSLKSLAGMCCISPSYLSNLFKSETGATLTDYITRQRIERAAYLLANGDDSVAQVGVQVGFLDDNYFTRTFKKIMGMPPTAYRKKFRVR